MLTDTLPEWLRLELAAAHPGITIKYLPWGDRKVFVLPLHGDAFWRIRNRKLGVVLYRRHITHGTSLKWQLHQQTYIPDPECVTDGRWVVFQENHATKDCVKLFDVINDDGSFHPLDRRVLAAIQVRDGAHGAHDKAIESVEGQEHQADARRFKQFEESTGDMFSRIYHDVKKAATDHACVTPDPLENGVIETGGAVIAVN